jgi:hypothetical protein
VLVGVLGACFFPLPTKRPPVENTGGLLMSGSG